MHQRSTFWADDWLFSLGGLGHGRRAHSESVARFGLIVWHWHEASQNREGDESVLAAHAEAASTKTLREEEIVSFLVPRYQHIER